MSKPEALFQIFQIFRFTRGWSIGVGELGLVLVHQMTQRINRLNASGPSNLKFHPLLSTQFQNFNFKYEPNSSTLQYNNIFKIHYRFNCALQRHHVANSDVNHVIEKSRFDSGNPLSNQLFRSFQFNPDYDTSLYVSLQNTRFLFARGSRDGFMHLQSL